jgi:outer membrane lipoprotein-sorting protein
MELHMIKEFKMFKLSRINGIIFSVNLLLIASSSLAQKESIDDIIKKIDELYRSKTSHCTMEMQIVTPDWERTLTMEAWSIGMDKTFVVIHSPKKEQGVATLRIDNEMWNYLPKTDKIMKIPPSMMMGSWMGSDFTNDDLVRESTMQDDYTYQFAQVENPKSEEIYIEFVPKEDSPIVWGKIVSAIRKSDYMPVWHKYYDEKGKLIRLMNFNDIRKFGDREMPATMELLPQTEAKKDNRTIIRYLSAEFDIKLDDKIFSVVNLRAKR